MSGAPGTTSGPWGLPSPNSMRGSVLVSKGSDGKWDGIIASVDAGDYSVGKDEGRANAHQIAASPALYDALEAMVGGKCPKCKGWGEIAYYGELVRCDCNGQYRHSPTDADIAAARDALALARGEQPGSAA